MKIQKVDMYINHVRKEHMAVSTCVGLAADETQRHGKVDARLPLVEYNKTEKQCLRYCYKLGYHWDGLYEVMDRVSCFCCPLQNLKALRALYKNYPDLWNQMIGWDKQMPEHVGGFRTGGVTVLDLDARFNNENL